ncbi:cobyric acid synthase [Gordonia rhizosphera]|uniref:Cobyric acid synthase n=1 Tax=Gordonia rhizosphera NBRC 16068 TaxID=1108045 RepID=K6VR33_9ACTN|nr:cobyric acid synthase [Gordonia rhizosphera]GAB89340.1 cobyric acid synthase [Gordonia rhizosphera NBRC 16068]
MKGALLVGGTSSDAGKSLVVAGLCRLFVRQGIRVAPFKAQNMSNNSVVTLDGGEIGRAQALQAYACGLAPSTRFNPVLLKPGSDRRSHVVVRGRPAGDVGARDYHRRRSDLAAIVAGELSSLRNDFDVVICEGAGSVAEINLRATDIANMGLAQAAGMPVLLVTDIDRGGSLAHLFGTTAVLDADDQRLIAGYVINKFRGDPSILAPGLHRLRELTGRTTLGVLPFRSDLWIDAEDSLAVPVGRRVGPPDAGSAGDVSARLTVAAVRLPRVSNTTDVEALACEPGVDVTWVDDPGSVLAADLAVLPGTRATVSDLGWLRERGIDGALAARARRGLPVLGICGGFQMLGTRIDDPVESRLGPVDGLGLLDVEFAFDDHKILRQVTGTAAGHSIGGYEIHHGRVASSGVPGWITDAVHGEEGAVRGPVRGTHWHGLMAADEFRRDFLRTVADEAGKRAFTVATDTVVDRIRTAQVDLIADLLEAHLDMTALATIVERGPDPDLPVIAHRLS